MNFLADVTVRDRHGQLIAVAEVKNPVSMSADVASELRRALLEAGEQLGARYFLVVSQDEAYVWDRDVDADLNAPPTLRIPMKSVFAKYLPSFDFNERIRGSELEYGVALWLQNLAWGDEFAKEATQDISAEFLAAVQGGAVSFGETV